MTKMEDKIEITPKILREAGFKESHFPYTAFKCSVKVKHDVEFDIEMTYHKHSCTYTIEVHEYLQNKLEDRCRFSGLSITSEVNDILSLFRYSDQLPKLQAESQSPDD